MKVICSTLLAGKFAHMGIYLNRWISGWGHCL